MIDSKMAFFIAEILLKFYQGYNNSIKEYIVTESNIFSDNDIKAYKLKSFLRAFALGAFPSKLWSGVETSHGLIILKKSGEVGALHILYSRDLENYLLNNSCFDTPSSTRHQFGEIYQDQNEYFIKLNLQIRIQQKHTI